MQGSESICPYCRKVKKNGDFFMGIGIQNNGRLPICKDCCSIKLNKYSAVLNEEAGAWVLMGELGLPFIREEWKSASNLAKTTATKVGRQIVRGNPIELYVKKLKDGDTVYQGFWDSDSSLNDLMLMQKKKQKEKDSVADLALMEQKWGKLCDSDEAYIFLENMFNSYTENLYNMDTNLENRYKDLCIAEYMKRKAQENGDVQEIAKAQDNVTKMLKLLKLDDFTQENDDRDRFIDRLIWKIEETEPAEDEDLDKYRDIAGYENIFNSWMRSMRNILANTREYPDIPKEEM